MTYREHKITETENGRYRITTPAGQDLAMTHRSIEAACVQVDLVIENRYATDAENEIINGFTKPEFPSHPRRRARTKVVFGNRVFVN